MFLDTISTPPSTPGPRMQRSGGFCATSSLSPSRQANTVIVCTAPIKRKPWEMEYHHYSDQALLLFLWCFFFFAFVILIHWFGAVCTVRHSASLLICEDSQCGQRVDHFLLAWEGERISPLDVCHVDKSVAGVERMNNPWSKDVYSTAWSWTAIFQLHLLCHGPADFFPPFFFFLKQYSRCCLERHFF